MNSIEILAPVGSMDSLYAAVENGANAVYLGGKLFNARQYASNFENEQLIEAVEYAHTKNVKVYVTVNILLDDNELNDAINYILFLYNIDIDAVIIQDIGLGRLIKEILPDFEIHASTQMTINNYMGVKFLEELGFQRVVMARELSAQDIKFIDDNSELELEGFIHGALCISYSGQCLMSSIIGGRSGNRGRCAQPCRMPYSFVNISSGEILSKKYTQKYLLSPKDLNTIDFLDKIIDSGISSLKIEGRMKRPEYVAVIVNSYRNALDQLIQYKKKKHITESEKKNITQIFNRGFTKGFILNECGSKFIAYEKPSNRGLYIGKVIKIDKKYMHILLEDEISTGDGIEIDNFTNESIGMTLDKIYISNSIVQTAKKGDIIKILKIGQIKQDSKVYKTSDINLLTKAKESYTKNENKIKIPINMAIGISINNPIKLFIWDNKNYVTIISDTVVEKGKKTFLTEEKIRNQMRKLGSTPYLLENIEINLDENCMVPISTLNEVRRKGIQELTEKRKVFNNRVKIDRESIKNKIDKSFDFTNDIKEPSKRKISISINNKEQFNQLDIDRLDRIYIPLMDDINDCIKKVNNYNKEIYITIDRIIGNKDFIELEGQLDKIDMSNINGIRVSNLGAIKFIKDKYSTNIHGDIGLNIFNSSSVKLLKNHGIQSITLSPELTCKQISNISNNHLMNYEAIGYGYLPLMKMKHCPLSLVKECDTYAACEKCNFREGFGIKDRKGMIFRLERKAQTTTLYNSQPLMVVEHLDVIYNSGIDMIRLDFTFEKEGISEMQTIFYDYCNMKISKDQVKSFVKKYREKSAITKGHYFRGVL